MRSGSSSRMHGVFGGITATSSLKYSRSWSPTCTAVAVMPHRVRVERDVGLHGDGAEHLALGGRVEALLGLDRRLQPVRPAPALGHPAAHLVDQLDRAAAHDVVDVAVQQRVGVQRDVDRGELGQVLVVVEVDAAELLLDRLAGPWSVSATLRPSSATS